MPDNIHQKLREARSTLPAIEKRGQNTAQHYSYAMAEDVIGAAMVALDGQGLVCRFEFDHLSIDNSGNSMVMTVNGLLVLTDPDSGEQITQPIVGAGADKPGDKAAYKAQTGAKKYGLLNLLGIAVGDDPDEERKKSRQQQQAKKPAAKKQPIPKPDKPLPDGAVNAIGKRIGEQQVGFDRLCVMFGTVGAEAPAANRSDSLKKALRNLTPEQAEQLKGLVG